MKNLRKFYIDGRWQDPISTETMSVLNPATEMQEGIVALGNDEDVNKAVAAAKKAFESFSKTTKQERLDLLHRLKTVTQKRFEDLAQAMRTEMGAPITMARDAQADAAIGHLDGFIEALESFNESENLSNGDELIREPIGVCGLITPWNWPMNQIALKVIPALATGCTCILKPSEHTPISAMIYAEIIDEAGFPAGVFNLVNGDGPTVGAALSKHPDIQMISFTWLSLERSSRLRLRWDTALATSNCCQGVKRMCSSTVACSPMLTTIRRAPTLMMVLALAANLVTCSSANTRKGQGATSIWRCTIQQAAL